MYCTSTLIDIFAYLAQICKKYVKKIEYEEHIEKCIIGSSLKEITEVKMRNPESGIECPYCNIDTFRSMKELDQHTENSCSIARFADTPQNNFVIANAMVILQKFSRRKRLR